MGYFNSDCDPPKIRAERLSEDVLGSFWGILGGGWEVWELWVSLLTKGNPGRPKGNMYQASRSS
jgi:hypothetical protein